MTDREMLELIIKNQQEMKQDVDEIKKDVAGLKQDVNGIKQEVDGIKQDVAVLRQEVDGIKQDVAVLKQDVLDLNRKVEILDERTIEMDASVRVLRLHLENVTDKNINILAENHMELVNRMNSTLKYADEENLYRYRVNVLEAKYMELEREIKKKRNDAPQKQSCLRVENN